MVETSQNLILIDWLSFSYVIDRDSLIALLGLTDLPWQKGLGSKYRYAERWQFSGISVHWSELDDFSHNPGCFVEMSGHGCREFETYGKLDFSVLIKYLLQTGANITRIDIAYDDFSGVIDIKEMFRAADNLEFRCRLNSFSLVSDHPDKNPDHAGRSICHGSRSSRTFFRCYDKRSERRAWDELPHWVRFEIQLRNENAMGFCQAPGDVGTKFFGVIKQYLDYCVPVDDENRSRWPLARWWSDFLDDCSFISVYTKKDIEYNRDRLERYVFTQAINAIRCAHELYGKRFFTRLMFDENGNPLPALPLKYKHILDREAVFTQKCRDELFEEFDYSGAVSQGRRDEILKSICGGT